MSTDRINHTLRHFGVQEAVHVARYRELMNDYGGYSSQSLRPIPISRETGRYSLPGLDFGLSRWTRRGWILGTTPLEQKECRVKETLTHFVIDVYCTDTARTYFACRNVGYNDPDADILFPEIQVACDRAFYKVLGHRAPRIKESHGLGHDIPPLPWYALDAYFFVDNYVHESPVFQIETPRWL